MDVIEGTVKPSDSQQLQLSSMEEFCKLSVPPLFGKVSINTLKMRACAVFTCEGVPDGWAYLKTLRETAYKHTKNSQLEKATKASEKPRTKLQVEEENSRRAQLHAHTTGIALSEIILTLHQFLTRSSTLSVDDRLVLEKILADSWCKFDTAISPINTDVSFGVLSVIHGGKPQ